MPRAVTAQNSKIPKPSFPELWQLIENFVEDIPPLQSRGKRPLQLTFEQQLKSLILFHLEEYDSARHLLQVLEQDDFARSFIAPPEGISRSSYGEALNTRGLEQLLFVYEKLQAQATSTLPDDHPQLGDLVAIDGTLIDAVCSMGWADYSSTTKKAKIHLGFAVNRGIPGKVYLTDGKADEGPLVPQLLSPGQTGIMDRNYQCYRHFDLWQEQKLKFVCRIKASTIKTCRPRVEISSRCLKRSVSGWGAVTADAAIVATNTPVIDRVAVHTKQAPYMTYVIGCCVPPGSVTPESTHGEPDCN